MMNQGKTKNILIGIALSLLSSSAWAGMKLSVVGDGPMTGLAIKGSVLGVDVSETNAAKIGYGGGLLASFGLGGSMDLTVGGIYQRRAVTESGETAYYPYIQIPVLVGFWLNSMIGVNVGGYYAMGVGNVTTSAGESKSYTDSGYSTSDYGVRGGLRFAVPMSGSTHLTLGADYIMGMKDLLSPAMDGVTVKWNGFEFLAGLSFGGTR